MNNNITQQNVTYKSASLITGFFHSGDTSNICQCGQVLALGSISCMPDPSAKRGVIAIRQSDANAWVVTVVHPITGVTEFGGERSFNSPCAALRNAAAISAQEEREIRPDLFDGDFDWNILIAKISDELIEEGQKMAATWQAAWANGDKRTPVLRNEHPLKVEAYEAIINGQVAEQSAEEVIEERSIGGVDYALKRIHDNYIIEETIIGAVFQSDPPYESLTEARFAFEAMTGQAVAQSQDYAGDDDHGEPIGYREGTQPYLY